MGIRLARTELDLRRCFPVMVQLRPHLSEGEFANRVLQQRQAGYQLAFLETEADGGGVKAVAGFRILENLAHGRLLYVDDLVTDQTQRSLGYGQQLLDWLVEQAHQQNCQSIQLDSGVQRAAAHRFYFRSGLTISSFRFIRFL